MKRFFRFIVAGRIALLVLVLVSLVPASLLLPKLENNNTIDTFLNEDDPGLAFYRENTALFGGDHLLYVALEAGERDIFSVALLQELDRLTTVISALEGIDEVISLTSTDAVLDAGSSVSVGRLLDQPPSTEEEVAHLEEQVSSSPLLQRLLSPDRSSALMVVEFDQQTMEDPTRQNQIIRAMRDVLLEEAALLEFRLAGNPVVAEAVERYNNRDQKVFSSLMLLLVFLSSILLLRRYWTAHLPIIVVLVTVSWTMGLFVATGQQTNWVTSIITPMLFLVCVADAVHFLTRYLTALANGCSKREAVVETLEAIWFPCLLTSVTTALGFASLLVNKVMPVKVFGIFASVGVLLAFVATMAVIPAALSLRDKPGAAKAPRKSKPSKLLSRLDKLVKHRPGLVLLVAVPVTALLAVGTAFIKVETNVLKYFPEDATVVLDSLFIEDTFGGSSPLDIIVDTGRRGGAQEPEVLRAVVALQDQLEENPEIARGISLADLLMELHAAFTGESDDFRVPDRLGGVVGLMDLPSPQTLEPMVDFNRQVIRISTRFQGARMGLKGSRALLHQIELASADLFPEEVTVRLTGSSVLFISMDEYLVTGQIQSFGIVLLVLVVIMIAQFRSVRVGLLAMIPNTLPIAVLFGLMGWLRMPIDGFTVMIASIAIGIGVDDTVHYLHHLKKELANGADLPTAMTNTVHSVGRALVFTTIVLALGFWVFCFSDFIGTRNFGFLTGVTILVALAADLLVLPAALRLLGVPRGWPGPRSTRSHQHNVL